MTKENYRLYRALEKELETSAMLLLEWYNENIEEYNGWENLEFEMIEENEIWFEGYDDRGSYTDSLQKVLPLGMLFLNDEGRKIFSDKFHQEKAEKYKKAKMNCDKIEAEQEAKATQERFEIYQELSKEFGEEVNCKKAMK